MSWIAVHEEILGGKLRGLRKSIHCSESEALGILTILWLWARRNADSSGMLLNAEIVDIAHVIQPSVREDMDASVIAQSLLECGWIDECNGVLYVHDWEKWQRDVLLLQNKRERDRLRKREERSKEKEAKAAQSIQKSEQTVKKAESKPKKPKKDKYAEYVTLYPEEYDKLVSEYGEPFTKKCIEILDNYKGSSGKTYKSDYRAILNWTVERCAQKYPHLKRGADNSSSIDMDEVAKLMNQF